MSKVKPRLVCHQHVVADDFGLFAGLDVSEVVHVTWHDESDPGDRGEFWAAKDAHGINWASDGKERIAALPERIFRFFRKGVAVRRNRVTDRYLQAMVPIDAGAVVVNFGANIGEVAVTLAERGASVIAIEPDPNVLPALRANATGRAIQVVPVAAWDTDGTLAMFIASETADTSAFNVSPDCRELPCQRVDTLIQQSGIDRVHLLVGDAEGAEPEVLAGASGILPITNYVSVCASAERRGERTLEACETILTSACFEIIHREEEGFCLLIAKARGI